MTKKSILEHLFMALIIKGDEHTCKDIPSSACKNEPRNFFINVGSIFLSKIADGLIDPKLILSWLITFLGGSATVIGLLVPFREAGALLPQLFTAGTIRKMPMRKVAWTLGSIGQGISAIAIGLSAIFISGEKSGWWILFFLTILALSRSICSVSYKDVLGKTVSKSRRGTSTGLASSLAAAIVIGFAFLMSLDIFPRLTVVLTGIFIAGGAWIAAAGLMITVQEEPGNTADGKSTLKELWDNLTLLKTETQLKRFIITRALLTATALAPPFMVAAANQDSLNNIGGLGILIIASSLSALFSSFVWGRLSDKSSRKVLCYAGSIAAFALVATAIAHYSDLIGAKLVLPILLFLLMTAYQGVRLGRSTHLVDMATPDTRAAYTALSNSVIGLVLIAGGAFSLVAAIFGIGAVFWAMAIMSALGAVSALCLEEVQQS